MKSIVDSALARERAAVPSARDYSKVPAIAGSEDSGTDNELEAMLSQLRTKIKVVGCGGGGSNTVARLVDMGVQGVEFIAANTDAQHLHMINVPKKILLGKKTTRGLGAGALPKLGEQATLEAEESIKSAMENTDLAFVTCGLGGGTGTGSAAFFCDVARSSGALTVAVATLPFKGEGKMRMENAVWGMEKLKKSADTVILVPNNRLLELVPRLPLNQAFKVADEILATSIRSLSEILTKPGLINLDFNDLRTIMKSGGFAVIGIGGSDGPADTRAKEATEHALASPMLDVDISGAKGVVVNVTGGPDMTIEQAQEAVTLVQSRIGPQARIIWGTVVDQTIERRIQVMIVVTGVNETFMMHEQGRRQEPHIPVVK
ncbi:MAG: cell division protein FtsZ [Methanobacteriota archaeon]